MVYYFSFIEMIVFINLYLEAQLFNKQTLIDFLNYEQNHTYLIS